MTLLIIFKLFVVIVALVMFLRRPGVTWGIGLLSVTTAVLFDTYLGTFGREEAVAELGFFYYIIGGLLFGGATLWLWGILSPLVGRTAVPAASTPSVKLQSTQPINQPTSSANAAFDRQMLYDEIRQRLGHEDLLDLIFDLGLNENDIIALNQDTNQLIITLMDHAEANGQTGALALAVERILTPPPPENLPRLEKIDSDSPATILRHYLLAHCDLAQLQQITQTLNIDWEQLTAGNKQTKVRALLLYLYRRNSIDALIDYLQQSASESE